MTVATELQRGKRSFRRDMVSDDVIQGPVERPSGSLQRVGDCTAQVARRALCMHVGPLLENAIHAGDEVDLAFEVCQWLQRGGEFFERLLEEVWILLVE